MNSLPLRIGQERDGRLLRLTLARPKANLIDMAMADAVRGALDTHRNDDKLLGVLIDHEGPHFSYGASIPEHLPETCAGMLAGMHACIRAMVAFPLPILVAIRGFCLGGGLELASAGTFLFAAPDATLGQPEIKLAVFAPTASVLLPERIGQPRADELLLTGRTVNGTEAERIGLVTRAADDPVAAALEWFDADLADKSAPALRAAVAAARKGYVERVSEKLDWVEKHYLTELMRHDDPIEGLRAFMEKRPPVWRHR
ncbi:MAG: cyclohexa-1,5-dienecarbonyl-CoA hydratase [Alphaproteobacteria bacterium]